VKRSSPFFRHSRENGNLAGSLSRTPRAYWSPAFAGMTLVVCILSGSLPAGAQDSLPPAPYAYRQIDDPALEAKAQALMETLRCLKCQSQSIADSDAPMAGDMRHQVRTRIAAGEDPEAVRAWLVERYGDYVSYKPTVSATTWPLFAIPLVLLALVGLILRRRLRRAP
jgi:cytochrome c-type biogenesis protein CcmH/NrfF